MASRKPESKRPHAASLNEVLIRRSDEVAWLIYKDHPFEATTSLRIGPVLGSLTDEQVLERFNAHINWVDASIAAERPIEIEDGCPQLYWHEDCCGWYPVGDVLRCEVTWQPAGDHNGEVAIRVDDKVLSAKEFLRILTSHEGWGMRLEFMHSENLTRRPKPLLKKRKPKRKQSTYPKFD